MTTRTSVRSAVDRRVRLILSDGYKAAPATLRPGNVRTDLPFGLPRELGYLFLAFDGTFGQATMSISLWSAGDRESPEDACDDFLVSPVIWL